MGLGNSCGPDDSPECPVQESAAKKAGVTYNGPNGSVMKNHGEKLVEMSTDEFPSLGSVWQVGGGIKKPLVSAGQAARAGFASWLDEPEGESYVVHEKSVKKIELNWINGVYKMRTWVRKPGFTRPGR